MYGKLSDSYFKNLDDVQAQTDGFPKIPINKVGVRNIQVPFSLQIRGSEEFFHTVARVSSYCDLGKERKGINMSRISRSINEFVPRFGKYEEVVNAVKTLKKNHNSKSAWIKIKFTYIISGISPLSQETSYEPVEVEMECYVDENDKIRNFITVESTEMSLCPCSKNMSLLINNLTPREQSWMEEQHIPDSLRTKIENAGFGAHNQKSIIRVTVEVFNGAMIWIEDLVDVIRRNSSCPTYTTLKRPDEKYVTEVSYMGGFYDEDGVFIQQPGFGPKFVEDIGRGIANELNAWMEGANSQPALIVDYCIVTENKESIHSGDISAVSVIFPGKELE